VFLWHQHTKARVGKPFTNLFHSTMLNRIFAMSFLPINSKSGISTHYRALGFFQINFSFCKCFKINNSRFLGILLCPFFLNHLFQIHSELELPGSEMIYSESDSGSGKKFWIRPDLDPQHCLTSYIFIETKVFCKKTMTKLEAMTAPERRLAFLSLSHEIVLINLCSLISYLLRNIRIHWLRIRIQHLSKTSSGPRVLILKNLKNIAENFLGYLKLQFTYPPGLL
jgi:hypothetical protein